jgi:hypothetical protein
MKLANTFAIALIAIGASIAGASAQAGPVATACKDDIPKYCAGKKHAPPEDEVRVCLEANKDKVSPGCKTALETTGGGRDRN